MSKTVSLVAPWVDHYKQVYELLRRDPELKVSKGLEEVTTDCYNFYIISKNAEKLNALRKVLRTNITFNNIILRMTFLNADLDEFAVKNDEGEVVPTEEDWNTAFNGNPLFMGVQSNGFGWKFAVFAHEIIDYQSDNLGDIAKYSHKLPAEIVQNVCRFSDSGFDVMACTYTPVE
ncbi:MAG: hypothetical protein IKR19_08690 [Acholeplasmatales bacterium]|nr:hypothetical protein [Acholeplasmatales bacterium]